jgi:hypothetical protein
MMDMGVGVGVDEMEALVTYLRGQVIGSVARLSSVTIRVVMLRTCILTISTATGTSPQFYRNGVGEHQRFQARDNGNQGWTFSPPRNFEGRHSGKPSSNGRSNRAYHQGHGRGFRNHPKHFHPGRANHQSRIRRSQSTASSWGERRKNSAMSSHEGMDAGPSSLKEPERQTEDRLLENTEPAVPHHGDLEQGLSVCFPCHFLYSQVPGRDPPSPSEPEFWEDGYEDDSSNQERTFIGGLEDVSNSNSRSIAADPEHRPAATLDRPTSELRPFLSNISIRTI